MGLARARQHILLSENRKRITLGGSGDGDESYQSIKRTNNGLRDRLAIVSGVRAMSGCSGTSVSIHPDCAALFTCRYFGLLCDPTKERTGNQTGLSHTRAQP
jgi:hypothetical protein